jgi:hypothetical protein
MTVYTVKAPSTRQVAANRAYLISGRTDDVLQHLRAGARPSLVGQIAGLTPKMEAAFRSGQRFILRMENGIVPEWVKLGGSVLNGAPWKEFGLPATPTQIQKERAVGAYEQWRKEEIFAAADETVPLSEAQTAFASEFGHFDLTLANPQTVEELTHVAHLLRFFAADVLPRDLLSTLDLNYHGFEGIRALNKYEFNKKILRFANPGNRWDRYLYTKMFLTGIGYAAFYTLSSAERDAFNLLYGQCKQQEGFLAADPTGRAPSEQLSFPALWDFFAGNFMQFHLLGEGMIDRSANWAFRAELQAFYAEHFSTVTA